MERLQVELVSGITIAVAVFAGGGRFGSPQAFSVPRSLARSASRQSCRSSHRDVATRPACGGFGASQGKHLR
jgi:hypothetical protein